VYNKAIFVFLLKFTPKVTKSTENSIFSYSTKSTTVTKLVTEIDARRVVFFL